MSKIVKIGALIFWSFIVLVVGILIGQSSDSAEKTSQSNITQVTSTPEPPVTETISATIPPTTLNKKAVTITPSTTKAKTSGVTMSQYNSLQNGMSYQEVVSILGSSGEELSSNELAGTKTVMYMWKGNSVGANMNAMFQDDKLMSKSQFGLK